MHNAVHVPAPFCSAGLLQPLFLTYATTLFIKFKQEGAVQATPCQLAAHLSTCNWRLPEDCTPRARPMYRKRPWRIASVA